MDDVWYAEALVCDGFEDALIGYGTRFNSPVAIYDYDQCVRILVERDGMQEDEAIEFLEFNTCGAYVGESTPVFLRTTTNITES